MYSFTKKNCKPLQTAPSLIGRAILVIKRNSYISENYAEFNIIQFLYPLVMFTPLSCINTEKWKKKKSETSDYGATKKHFTRRPSFPRHITLQQRVLE